MHEAVVLSAQRTNMQLLVLSFGFPFLLMMIFLWISTTVSSLACNVSLRGFKALIGQETRLDCLKNNNKPFGNPVSRGFKEFQTLWKCFGNALETN